MSPKIQRFRLVVIGTRSRCVTHEQGTSRTMFFWPRLLNQGCHMINYYFLCQVGKQSHSTVGTLMPPPLCYLPTAKSNESNIFVQPPRKLRTIICWQQRGFVLFSISKYCIFLHCSTLNLQGLSNRERKDSQLSIIAVLNGVRNSQHLTLLAGKPRTVQFNN